MTRQKSCKAIDFSFLPVKKLKRKWRKGKSGINIPQKRKISGLKIMHDFNKNRNKLQNVHVIDRKVLNKIQIAPKTCENY